MTMRGIPAGYYKTATTSTDGVQCEQNNKCTTTASTGCDAMKYSELGQSYCTRVAIGYEITGGYKAACSETGYNTVTSSCVTCSYKKCDQYTGLTQTCPVGFYFSYSSTFSCSTCGAGYYCEDGVSRVTASSTWPVSGSQNGTPQRCPAGYYCSYNSITITSDSYYSLSE